MIKKTIEDSINNQVNKEIYSGYLYLSMSAYFQSTNLSGFAGWMEIQAAEEFSHVKRLYDFLFERGGRVNLMPIDGPPSEWKSPVDVFEETLKHEVKVTGLINDMVGLAIKEKDYATNNMLQWFVAEQVEEEATVSEILEQLKMVGSEGNGLYLIDKDLGQRALNPAIFAGTGD